MIRRPPGSNLAIATLWADRDAGVEGAIVQRQYTSSIAGEIPPDQRLPEVLVLEDSQLSQARALLFELQHPRERRWVRPAGPGTHRRALRAMLALSREHARFLSPRAAPRGFFLAMACLTPRIGLLLT